MGRKREEEKEEIERQREREKEREEGVCVREEGVRKNKEEDGGKDIATLIIFISMYAV